MYEKYIGKRVDIITKYRDILSGILIEYDTKCIILKCEDKEIMIYPRYVYYIECKGLDEKSKIL